MKVSDLIEFLKGVLQEHGDREVSYVDFSYNDPIEAHIDKEGDDISIY